MKQAEAGIPRLSVIGVGPGDPGYLTVKAGQRIGAAELVLVPRSEQKSRSLALEIARPFLKQTQMVQELIYPMLRDKTRLAEFWQRAGNRVSGLLGNYTCAAFLTLGDPSVYSTWTYLRRALLAAGHREEEWEILPGITSFSAGAALLKRELVSGEENFCVLAMPSSLAELKARVALFEKVIIMKIGRKWPRLREWLTELGLAGCTEVVSRAGMEGQQAAPLDRLTGGEAEYLSLAIIQRKTCN